jgi:flavin-dependent dehydrogenase
MEMGLPLPDYWNKCLKRMGTKSHILIVGGGLAGLSLAILLAQKDYKVHLWEKGAYPRHKVCGEYISTESIPFLEHLGIGEEVRQWPSIKQLVLTTEHGYSGTCTLDTGGVGVSRYHLDYLLVQKAQSLGVEVVKNKSCKNIRWDDGVQQYWVKPNKGAEELFKLVIGAFGRNNGLLPLANQNRKYLGVKYHIADGPDWNTIEMHHFKGGYCGVSAVENNHFCLCYIVDSEQLQPLKGDISALERKVLSSNPFLKERLQAARLFQGVRTAHIVFGTPDLRAISYPVTGDALGFIPPITGNGMSLAFRSAAYLLPICEAYLNGNITRLELIHQQRHYAQQYLQKRRRRGVFLHNLITNRNPLLQRTILKGLTQFPAMMRLSAKMAVGKPF